MDIQAAVRMKTLGACSALALAWHPQSTPDVSPSPQFTALSQGLPVPVGRDRGTLLPASYH